MQENGYPIEKIKSLAGNLVNRKILNAESAGRGNNNKVYRVQTTGGFYALKIYSSQIGEPWDRLGTEFSALNFLYSNGFTCIPRAIAKDQKNNCALYEWIDGQPIASISNEELHIVVSFLLQIQSYIENKMAKSINNASASCFSINQVLKQIDRRLRRLTDISSEMPQLKSFLRDQFKPIYQDQCEIVFETLSKYDLDKDRELEAYELALSPSDFGIHNTLRSTDGKLIFFDFEYFGWDDPVKMVSDAILHPGNSFSLNSQKIFYNLFKDYYKARDPYFILRFQITYPLYALIWCLIMLGDFLPDQWARRVFAGESKPKIDFQIKKLGEAQILLNNISAPGFSSRITNNK